MCLVSQHPLVLGVSATPHLYSRLSVHSWPFTPSMFILLGGPDAEPSCSTCACCCLLPLVRAGVCFASSRCVKGQAEAADAAAGAQVAIPAPDPPLPPSFDADTHTHRYRFLEQPGGWLARCGARGTAFLTPLPTLCQACFVFLSVAVPFCAVQGRLFATSFLTAASPVYARPQAVRPLVIAAEGYKTSRWGNAT